ncbi:MAG TPA: hypothetical protein VLB51_15330, partial [Methylomirabilota bacterium]|nr:hypothetical protein [Methylomirabilota bacterium]
HVGVLDRPWADVPGDGWVLTGRSGGGAIDLELHTRGRVDNLRLDLGDRTLLHGSVGTAVGAGPAAIQWSGAAGDLITTRGHPDQDASAILAAGGGGWCISARVRSGDVRSWCTRKWRLAETTVPVAGLSPPPLALHHWHAPLPLTSAAATTAPE